jgi:flagellar biosynthetic protein FliR
MIESLLPQGFGYLLVLFRCGGLCATAPILASQAVPRRVRLGMSLFFAMAAWAAAGSQPHALPQNMLDLALVGASETMIGLCAGFAAKVALDAASAAGSLAGNGMGIGYGQMIDPNSGAEAPVLGNLLSGLALGAAVALGLHREAILWLARSVREIPVGGLADLRELSVHMIRACTDGAVLGLRLGLPFLGAVSLGHLGLGLMGRSTPQISLQSVGFTIAIFCGGAALWYFAPTAAHMAAGAAVAVFSRTGG